MFNFRFCSIDSTALRSKCLKFQPETLRRARSSSCRDVPNVIRPRMAAVTRSDRICSACSAVRLASRRASITPRQTRTKVINLCSIMFNSLVQFDRRDRARDRVYSSLASCLFSSINLDTVSCSSDLELAVLSFKTVFFRSFKPSLPSHA